MLTPAVGQLGSPPGQLLDLGVVVSRTNVVVILQQNQQKKIKGQHSKLPFKFRAACSAAGPELRGYTQRCADAPPQERKDEGLLRLSDKSAVRLASSQAWELKAAARMLW